ncbi:MAG TPA: hypothetical protein VLG76_01670 [Rhabdochlamydiaceae bacterium]|nr:hypothetical protein [Rhabdochlamydiaceae bacterium]
MYASELGWAQVQHSIDSSSDDDWLAFRLGQIKDGVQPSELISRWTFETKDATGFSYVGYLIARVGSYALFIFPLLIVSTNVGLNTVLRIIDYFIDTGLYIYSKVKGTEELYQSKKDLTQLFLTLAIAHQRIADQEQVEQKMRLAGALWEPGNKRMYLYHFKRCIRNQELNRRLWDQAFEKTIATLSPEDLKTLLVAIQIFPRGSTLCPDLQKKFVLKALEVCDGSITLPRGLEFDHSEINYFTLTRCKVDLNGAYFSNITLEDSNALGRINDNSINKAHFIYNY